MMRKKNTYADLDQYDLLESMMNDNNELRDILSDADKPYDNYGDLDQYDLRLATSIKKP